MANFVYKTIKLQPRISESSKRPNTSKELLGFFLIDFFTIKRLTKLTVQHLQNH